MPRVVLRALAARLTTAPDFAAHLDVYDAVLTETGGGMVARVSSARASRCPR